MQAAITALARELLSIQSGSVEDALSLADDFPEGDEKDLLIAEIERLGETINGDE